MITSILLTSLIAITSDDALHPAAHIGSSYIITHAGEVACKKITNWNKTTCSLISGTIATGLGIAIEMTQNENDKSHAKSYIENAAGVALAIGIIHLDF